MISGELFNIYVGIPFNHECYYGLNKQDIEKIFDAIRGAKEFIRIDGRKIRIKGFDSLLIYNTIFAPSDCDKANLKDIIPKAQNIHKFKSKIELLSYYGQDVSNEFNIPEPLEEIEAEQQIKALPTSDKINNRRIFVSHSSKDNELVSEFVDKVLILGMGVKQGDIFYTSGIGMGIKSGEDFKRRIEKEVKTAKAVIQFLTPNYKGSEVCLNEMGAAWAVTEIVIPLLGPPFNYDVGFLHASDQQVKLNDRTAIISIYDDHKSDLFDPNQKNAILADNVDKFVAFVSRIKEPEENEQTISAQAEKSLEMLLAKFDGKLKNSLHAIDEKKDQVIKEILEAKSVSLNQVPDATSNETINKLFDLAFIEPDDEVKLNIYNEIIKAQPRNFSAINNRGVAYSRLQMDDKAVIDFEKSFAINNQFLHAPNNAAGTYIRMRNFKKAKESLKLVLEVDPNNATGLSFLGVIQFLEKDNKNAIVNLERAIKLDPLNPVGHFNLGYYYLENYEERNMDKAEEFFIQSENLGKRDSEVYNNLAVTFRRKGDIKRAEEYLSKAKKHPPINPLIYGTMALLYADQGKTEEFYTYLEIAMKKGCKVWNYMNDIGFDKYRDSEKLNNLIDKYKNQQITKEVDR